MLTTVGATGLASVGMLGFMTEDSIRYTETVPVEGGALEVDWRETYRSDGETEVREDTRSTEFTSEGAVIELDDVLPGDVGTVSFRLRNPEDSASTVESKLSLDLSETAENERIDPENEAGDTTADEGELQDFLDTKLWYDEGLANFDVLGGDNATQDGMESLITGDAEGTLADVADAVDNVSLGELGPGEDVTVSFRWEFDGDVDPRDVGITQTDRVKFAFLLDTTSTGEI